MTIQVTTDPDPLKRMVHFDLETAQFSVTYTVFRQLVSGGLLDAISAVAGIPVAALQQLNYRLENINVPMSGEVWTVQLPDRQVSEMVFVEELGVNETTLLTDKGARCKFLPIKNVVWIRKEPLQIWPADKPAAGEFWMAERPRVWSQPARIHIETISDTWIDYTFNKPGMTYSVARADMKFLHKTESQDWNFFTG